MTRTLGELIWRITGDTSQFDKSAKSTSAKANELGKTGTASFNGMKLSSIAMGIGASAAFMKVISVTKESIEVARDAQEMISKYNVVFGGMGDASEEAATRFATAFDLAGATAKEMLANTGNLLQGFGATKEESLALSEQVNTLASDLASFTNNQGGAKVASEALTKALLGEREQAKTLGIAILESDVQLRLAQKGQDSLTGTAMKLAKAQATLEIITEQAKNAIGDYARTADSASNTQKRAGEATKELQNQLGTKMMPAVTIVAKAWGDFAGAVAEVIKKQNDLREGQKSDVLNNDTIEKKILYLQEERKQIEKNLEIGREKAKQYGYDYTAQEKLAAAQIKLNEEGIKAAERQIKIRDEASKKQIAADDKAAKDAQAKLDLDALITAQYEKSRDIVSDTLEDQKSDYQKIQEQINQLQSTPWAKGELETERLAAIEALKKKLVELKDEELVANDETRAAAREKLSNDQSVIDSVINLGKATEDETAKSKKAAIQKIKDSGLIKEQQDELIKAVEEYYDALEDSKAAKKFMDNMSVAFDAGVDIMGAYFDLINQLNDNAKEEELDLLALETDALSDALDERQRLEDAALKESQEAQKKALEDKYDLLTEELDAELQSVLFNAGLANAATVEQYAIELQEAIATGDAKKIKTAQDAYDKAVIEEEYAAKKKALEEQQAADTIAIKEAQDKATLELDKKQADEKEKLDKEQAQKNADITYKYQLASWKMQLAMATAAAAQAVINAYMSAAAVPITGWLTAPVAAGLAAGVGALQIAAVVAAQPKAPKLAEGGSFIVPPGYDNDTYPIAWAQSGERVTVETPEQQRLQNVASNATIVLQLDGNTIAQSTVTLVNNGKYLIKGRSII